MNPEEILTALVIAKELVNLLNSAAKQNGYTQEDLDKADANRAEAIAKFKKEAGIA